MKKEKTAFIVAMIILGIMIGFQTEVIKYKNRVINETKFTKIAVDEMLTNERERSKELKSENERLEGELKARGEELNHVDEKLKNDRDTAFLIAGLVDVKGNGVKILMNDAVTFDKEETFNADKLVHDADVRELINALKCGGTQAISVNGERLTPLSTVVCAGPTMLINGRRYTVPYEIIAIGDVERLVKSVLESRIYNDLIHVGLQINVTKETDVFIPKYIR